MRGPKGCPGIDWHRTLHDGSLRIIIQPKVIDEKRIHSILGQVRAGLCLLNLIAEHVGKNGGSGVAVVLFE
jgi:hypothetical protein